MYLLRVEEEAEELRLAADDSAQKRSGAVFILQVHVRSCLHQYSRRFFALIQNHLSAPNVSQTTHVCLYREDGWTSLSMAMASGEIPKSSVWSILVAGTLSSSLTIWTAASDMKRETNISDVYRDHEAD